MAQDNPFAKYVPAAGGARAPAMPLPSPPKIVEPAKPPSSYEQGQDTIKNKRDTSKDRFDQTMDLRKQFEGAPPVKSYRVAIPAYVQGLKTAPNPQGDLALTYAFAKLMDPDSVVREAEQGAIVESQPWFQAKAEQIKKQFGMDGAGNFSEDARRAIRAEMHTKISTLNRAYTSQRARYKADAMEFGVNPDRVLGEHDGRPFFEQIEGYWREHGGGPGAKPASKPKSVASPKGFEFLGFE